MNKKGQRANSNLAMLEIVARKLEELNDEVVFLGGCATALFITDPLSLDVRTTLDVDCIIDVISKGDYYKFENKLRKKGFKQSLQNDIMCRWVHQDDNDIILDVMPSDEKILGFSNPWFNEALEHVVTHQIADDLIIRSITAPYFLATKLEAFKTRGKKDFLASSDFEDIITVIDGRVEIAGEIITSSERVRGYLKQAFEAMLNDSQFEAVLPGHLNDGNLRVTLQRVKTVKERILKIIKTDNKNEISMVDRYSS